MPLWNEYQGKQAFSRLEPDLELKSLSGRRRGSLSEATLPLSLEEGRRSKKMIQRRLATLALVALAGLAFAAPHKITATKARKIALAKVHGKIQGTPKLENEDGVWQYAVIVVQGKTMKEIGVNADTGKITAVETVTAAEEAKEAKEDAMKAKGKGKKKG